MYHQARQYIGQPVVIRDIYGREYQGVIRDVNQQGVSLVRFGHTSNIFIPLLLIGSLFLLWPLLWWGWW